MDEVLIEPHPLLRRKAEEIKKEDIQTPDIRHLIKTMAEILLAAPNGVGLAASQIGVSKRIFIVLKKTLAPNDENTETYERTKKNALGHIDIYINPKIIKRSKKKAVLHEGCLSVPDVYGAMKRYKQVTIQAFNEHGEKIERGASGLLAQIFQHEIDHLNGILFIDAATIVPDDKPKKI